MYKILALETSSEACSVALWCENRLDSLYQHAPRQHGELLLPMVKKVLDNSNILLKDLDAIAVSIGPGSFTGLRIGVSVAKALAFSVDIPVIGISSLASLAYHLLKASTGKALVALDARQQEIYWGAYSLENNKLVACQPESVILPANAQTPKSFLNTAWVAGGIGWSVYGETLSKHIDMKNGQILNIFWPRAEEVALLAIKAYEQGNYHSPEALLPVYLRNKVTG